MQSQRFGIVATMTAVVLVMSSAVPQISSYSVFAKSNAQTSGANNDCPTGLVSIIIGVQQQANANCLNDANMLQDSEGASIASTPFNAAPSQAIDLDVGIGERTPPIDIGCPDDYVWDLTLDQPFGDLPTGTVLCSFNGLGLQTVQIGDSDETIIVVIEEPDGETPCGESREGAIDAHASSGQPPNALEIDDRVCVFD